MSDEDKKQEDEKDSSTGNERKRKSTRDGSNTEGSSVSFGQKKDESKGPSTSSVNLKHGPKVAAKPKKSSIRSSSSEAVKNTVSQNHEDEKPGFSKSYEKINLGSYRYTREGKIVIDNNKDKEDPKPSSRSGKAPPKNLEDVEPHTSRRKQRKTKPDNDDGFTSTRRHRETFDSFDREAYLANMIDYERSSDGIPPDSTEKKQRWKPDSSLRHRYASNHETKSKLSFQGEEEGDEIDSVGSATMRSSSFRRSRTDDNRSVILAEVIDIGRLEELRDQQESNKDQRNDRTIDEIKGYKTTGTCKSHVDEVKWRETSSDEDSNASVKHRGTITKISRAAQRVEEESLKTDEDGETPPPETEKELRPKRRWTFPITDTFSEIPGERQPLRENQKVKIGKRNKKIRSIGVNTEISRKPPKLGDTAMPGETDSGVYHDDGKMRDIGQVTERVYTHRKKIIYKTDSDDYSLDIELLDDRVREIGVNTRKLPKTNYPPISRMYFHDGGKLIDVGSNTDKSYKPIDDGTEVIYMNPIMYDNSILNRLIVDPPPDNDPYKMPAKDDRRAYYKGCEYHFPGRTGWRRLFYNRTFGKYELRRPSHFLYTLIFATCYILFILLFSMAWFDYVTDEAHTKSPVLKMSQPSLTFAPIGPRTNPKAISFDPQNNTEILEKYSGIMALLQKYGDSGQSPRFGTCNAYENFGYPSGEPCVFLKVNRLIGFKTEPFTDSDELVKAKLDEADFAALKSLLQNTTSEEERQNRTWITCRTDMDKKIEIEFHPEPAFRTEYTDIKEKIEYVLDKDKKSFFGPNDLNRIVALKIKNLKANERVQVNCKMWAQNIHYNQEGFGQISFYVLLANDKNRERVEKVLRHHDSL